MNRIEAPRLTGELIRQLRKAGSLSQAQLARAIDVTENQVWFYEAGVRVPSAERSEMIVNATREAIAKQQALINAAEAVLT